MTIDYPKTSTELRQWKCLGSGVKMWQKFSYYTGYEPKSCLTEWQNLVESGNIIMEANTRTAWVRRSVLCAAVQAAQDVDRLHDGVTPTQREDLARLLREGWSMADASYELGLGEYSNNESPLAKAQENFAQRWVGTDGFRGFSSRRLSKKSLAKITTEVKFRSRPGAPHSRDDMDFDNKPGYIRVKNRGFDNEL
jgi:hypothetical protein